MYKDDLWEGALVDTEVIETPGRDLDFDQINEEKITFSRVGGGYQQHSQQTQNVVTEEVDAKKALEMYNHILEESEKEQFPYQQYHKLQKSK